MQALTGWLLDVYAPQQSDDPCLRLWLIGQDGERRCLRQPFPVTFYAAGPPRRLEELSRLLQNSSTPLRLAPGERRDLFASRPLPVLGVEVLAPAAQPGVFNRLAQAFPDLTYYDADISLPLRHAARYAVFPLGRCELHLDAGGLVHEIRPLETPWEIDVPLPPLRILHLEPDADPARQEPRRLHLRCGRCSYRLDLEPPRPLLVNLRAILRRHDPDLLLTRWGDAWLLPRLIDLSRGCGLELPLNRDPECQAVYRPERSYFSYGQVIYHDKQTYLFGRCHIDQGNAMLWDDYELDGALETARVTALPLQTAARVSPGTGISSMQIVTALRQGILVPWHKQQAEYPKTARQLFATDQGGLVYQPLIGIHRHVGEIDFISMYPGIMVRFNISPETAGGQRPRVSELQPLPSPPGWDEPDQVEGGALPGASGQAAGHAGGLRPGSGLVPQTLAPLLEKRITLKTRMACLPRWDPRRRSCEARAAAHKWLLVTCFGYLGYKNARFGRIEAHEAVTAYGREALLRAKEAAEDLGFTVLHMYVDGLWIQKPGASQAADFQPVLDEIVERTGLPIALDGVYRWVAFLPSRVDNRVPVANRYFGVFQDGSLKVRGVEARRGDAPSLVAETQMRILELMAGYEAQDLSGCLPAVYALLRRRVGDLRSGRTPLASLVISQRLSRGLDEYRSPSPAARAAAQLAALGRELRPGQRVRFVYTRGRPGVHAWDQPAPLNPVCVDVERYITLLLRAAHAVLELLPLSQAELQNQVLGQASALQLPSPGQSAAAGLEGGQRTFLPV